MPEYIAIVFGLGIIMFYLLEFSRQFASDDNKLADKYLQFVRLFYVIASMITGLVLLYSLYEIGVLTSASTGILSGLTTSIWAWGIILLLTSVFMAVYFLIIVPAMIKKAIDLKGKRDDGGDD